MTPQQRSVIEEWSSGFMFLRKAHYAAAVSLSRRNYWLGIPALFLSTIVGTTVFSTLNQNPDPFWRIIVGFLSLITAVLASLQTFLKLSERAEKHRLAGARFAALRKETEQALALPPQTDDELKTWFSSLRQRWDKLSEDSPTIPPSIWEKDSD